jgi:hypothetical protein
MDDERIVSLAEFRRRQEEEQQRLKQTSWPRYVSENFDGIIDVMENLYDAERDAALDIVGQYQERQHRLGLPPLDLNHVDPAETVRVTQELHRQGYYSDVEYAVAIGSQAERLPFPPWFPGSLTEQSEAPDQTSLLGAVIRRLNDYDLTIRLLNATAETLHAQERWGKQLDDEEEE